jgi:hypothetical protein
VCHIVPSDAAVRSQKPRTSYGVRGLWDVA